MARELKVWECGGCAAKYPLEVSAVACERKHEADNTAKVVLTQKDLRDIGWIDLDKSYALMVLRDYVKRELKKLEEESRLPYARRVRDFGNVHSCRNPFFNGAIHSCKECEYWEAHQKMINSPG